MSLLELCSNSSDYDCTSSKPKHFNTAETMKTGNESRWLLASLYICNISACEIKQDINHLHSGKFLILCGPTLTSTHAKMVQRKPDDQNMVSPKNKLGENTC